MSRLILMALLLSACADPLAKGERAARPTGSSADEVELPLEVCASGPVVQSAGRITARRTTDSLDLPGISWAPQQVSDVAVGNRVLAVLDAPSREITVFDDSLRPLHRFGREGSGPGEFRDPVAIAIGGGDSTVYVVDNGTLQLSVLSIEGGLIRTFRLGGAASDITVDHTGTVYVARRVQTHGANAQRPQPVVLAYRTTADAPDTIAVSDPADLDRNNLPALVPVILAHDGATKLLVAYPAAGIIDVFEGDRRTASVRTCMTPRLADAYRKQLSLRQSDNTLVSQNWVALIADVAVVGGVIRSISPVRTQDGVRIVEEMSLDGGIVRSIALSDGTIPITQLTRLAAKGFVTPAYDGTLTNVKIDP